MVLEQIGIITLWLNWSFFKINSYHDYRQKWPEKHALWHDIITGEEMEFHLFGMICLNMPVGLFIGSSTKDWLVKLLPYWYRKQAVVGTNRVWGLLSFMESRFSLHKRKCPIFQNIASGGYTSVCCWVTGSGCPTEVLGAWGSQSLLIWVLYTLFSNHFSGNNSWFLNTGALWRQIIILTEKERKLANWQHEIYWQLDSWSLMTGSHKYRFYTTHTHTHTQTG